ncbi:MAG: EamA family transporter [Clostridia bacterium]|nr:EamA family transporter [Clostridia bacterium]
MIKKLRKKASIMDIVFIQASVIIYTLSGVAGKFASQYDFFTFEFILCYGIEIIILGVYAILWQQIIKKYDLSVTYANRSVALLWSMAWAVLLFHETVTLKNIVGVVFVIIGTMIVNGEAHE